ncbi:MAG: hypothetical protein V4717_14615 [Bacteroidota bacterium]
MKKETKYGSCIFVSDTSCFSYYLVTADHVAKDMTESAMIELNGEGNKTLKILLNSITLRKDKIEWVTHPTADVSCVLLDPKFFLNSTCKVKPFPFQWIENGRTPIPERSIHMVGFVPTSPLKDTFKAEIVLTKVIGRIDSLPRFDTEVNETSFVLQDNSIGGLSGGPILELPTILRINGQFKSVNVYRLIGIVHGTTDGSSQKGHAIVASSYYVRELILRSPKYSGLVEYFHKNGRLWSQVEVRDGLVYTVLNNLDSSGKRMQPGTLRNGHGSKLLYDENRILREIWFYNEGKLVNVEKKNSR